MIFPRDTFVEYLYNHCVGTPIIHVIGKQAGMVSSNIQHVRSCQNIGYVEQDRTTACLPNVERGPFHSPRYLGEMKIACRNGGVT